MIKDEIKVYGSRPDMGAMAGRARREGFDTAELVPVLVYQRGQAYMVRGWARKSPNPVKVCHVPGQWDDAEAWYVYTTRRDGKIECDLRGRVAGMHFEFAE